MKSKEKKSYWNLFYFVILPLIFGITGWYSWSWWQWIISSPYENAQVSSSLSPKRMTLSVSTGSSSQKIGQDLEKAGIIRSNLAWKIWTKYLQFKSPQGSYQAGTYQIPMNASLPEIADQLWTGKTYQVRFTIPEGWSIVQMGDYFQNQGYFSQEDFIIATRKIPQDKFEWLPDNLPHLEGFLYPDTYQLPLEKINPSSIIEVMLKNFEKQALPLYQSPQNTSKFSLLEWVILASIVEKEAVVQRERPIIAGVFLQRLKKGMKLESDPTVEYGLGIKQTPDQPLTLAQVRTPNPYNTYYNLGLPPTAIGSPSLASLQAVLKPEITDNLYFVARYDGTHVFSKTLDAHLQAVKAIRQSRQQNP